MLRNIYKLIYNIMNHMCLKNQYLCAKFVCFFPCNIEWPCKSFQNQCERTVNEQRLLLFVFCIMAGHTLLSIILIHVVSLKFYESHFRWSFEKQNQQSCSKTKKLSSKQAASFYVRQDFDLQLSIFSTCTLDRNIYKFVEIFQRYR